MVRAEKKRVTFEENSQVAGEGDPLWLFLVRVQANPRILERKVDRKRFRDFGIGLEYTVSL